MIPHTVIQMHPLQQHNHHNHPNMCSIATANNIMDGSANDRATKRLRGVVLRKQPPTDEEEDVSESNHTASTADSTSSEPSLECVLGKKYRRVSFQPVTEINECSWSQEDVMDFGWYTKDELAMFKQERKALVKLLKRVHFDQSQIDTTVHCLRGYEAYFSLQANKEYKSRRQMVVQAVLQEQARQVYLNRRDALMMQLVSSHATQWARETAASLATADAQVALQIFLEHLEEEDELEDYDDCDYDDDAPIAVNWDEPLLEEEELNFPFQTNHHIDDDDDHSLEPIQLQQLPPRWNSAPAAANRARFHSHDGTSHKRRSRSFDRSTLNSHNSSSHSYNSYLYNNNNNNNEEELPSLEPFPNHTFH